MLGSINFNAGKVGKQLGGFIKSTSDELKKQVNVAKEKASEFSDGIKSELNTPGDQVTLSSSGDMENKVMPPPLPVKKEETSQVKEEVSTPPPLPETKEQKVSGDEKKKKIIGAAALGFMVAGPLGAAGLGYLASKDGEKKEGTPNPENGDWQGKLKDTGEQFQAGFGKFSKWCEKAFAPSSTIKVNNGAGEQTIGTNGNKNAPQTLTVIE